MKQLHKTRLRNIELRDECNKMQGFNAVSNQKQKTLQADNAEKAQGY